MARQLLARGDRVAGTSRRVGASGDLAAEHGDRFVELQLDLTDRDAVRTVVDEAWDRLRHVDVVVSNAGYGLFGAAEELDDAEIERQIATNLTGSIRLIRAALPHLRAQGGGRIVQVSSEGGQIAYPNFSVYHATKWGIEGFVEAVAQEVAPFGIDFIIAEPGPTATGFRAGVVQAAAIAAYEATPSGELRRMIADGRFVLRGDAARTAAEMITAADSPRPRLRLPLGSSPADAIPAALRRRLNDIDAQRDVALRADRAG